MRNLQWIGSPATPWTPWMSSVKTAEHGRVKARLNVSDAKATELDPMVPDEVSYLQNHLKHPSPLEVHRIPVQPLK